MRNPYVTWTLVVLLVLLIAAIAMIVWRSLNNLRIYAGYKRPKKFDFNLIVIGAGSAGLVSAYIAATGRAKIALIERDRMGGDCLNTGCVPSKALLRTARLAAEARHAERYGIARLEAEIDFAAVMKRVQSVIGKIAPHDSVERYTELGVDVIKGEAKLISPWEVKVGRKTISARSIVIATGAGPLVPKIEGVDSVEYLTSDNLWDLRKLPKKLVVLGGGPIGCEMTQAFARLGSHVTQVEMAQRLLQREDADAAAEVQKQLDAEGIKVMTQTKAVRVEAMEAGGQLICEQDGKEIAVPFDRLLIALGRKANIEGFGLEELGVKLTKRGTVEANELLQTNYPNILVAGDAVGPYQFTHVAAHQAWYAALNGLLAPFWSFKVDYRVIPWATFTEPEVARVGLSEDEAKKKNIDVEVTRYPLDDLDRAIADSADNGFVKVLTKPGKDEILGVVIVGAHAADLLAEFVLAMKHGLGLNKILGTIHTYPTMSEANKYVAGNWKRNHAPEGLLKLSAKFFTWRRN
ncbi:MAG: FAD-dependent oxidoreductase [Dokdonella sp.]